MLAICVHKINVSSCTILFVELSMKIKNIKLSFMSIVIDIFRKGRVYVILYIKFIHVLDNVT